MVIAVFWFSLSGVLLKLAGRELPFIQLVWVRGIVGGALGLALLGHAGVSPLGVNRKLLVLRGIIGFFAMIAIFFSFVRLPLGEATVLFYLNPLFVALFAVPVLGEAMTWRRLACVVLGLAGAALVAKPAGFLGYGPALDGLGVVASMAGAALAGGVFVLLRKLGATEHEYVSAFYLCATATLLAAPFAIHAWQWPTAWEWMFLIGIGVTTQLGQILMARAFQLENAGTVSTVGYLQIVFAAAWSALFFSQWPDAWAIAGGTCIVASTLALKGSTTGKA
jgi:drug/metabolite transporter (DMT)-like permease